MKAIDEIMEIQCQFVKTVLKDRFYICQNMEKPPESKNAKVFVPDEAIQYYSLCDDFGPLNMSSIMKFVRQLDEEMTKYPSMTFFYAVENGVRNLTNAVFLVGAFLIFTMKFTIEDLKLAFIWADSSKIQHYRDATYSKPTFHLTLEDCWLGLMKGIDQGWVVYDTQTRSFEGKIDDAEYDHYENPLNGDFHFVVPDKFIAFKGPVDLGDKEYDDDDQGFRNFSPSYYADVFNQLGVTTVVRLNESHYDPSAFTQRGISFHHLEFQDCSAPPTHIAAEFLQAVDASHGLVAVHCKAGLG
eukprot:CAMPEP_0113707778 /NCGR_PEP_ID=MMETSP0038_2-20120614/28597_1 /TAXON_ID=2898 /ORGANISM="Cryptomonas paramecium" /LENGTH=298 /DNA_ID=CAMNT_0000633375 /DNA_START=1 /DNA_END=893 /DNA_ORIENTATION=- /assembly_acc=CAM_ASM_000170